MVSKQLIALKQVAELEGKTWKWIEHEYLPDNPRPKPETPPLPEGKKWTLNRIGKQLADIGSNRFL